ncbi:MAG: tripartite tricarboxylate transporter substrate binding protein [Proteobacteria bacterium]|nr:tripartite tricarboxylate transporter substrate binding protein [Pseudomonadota bacterium]MBU1451473.1 tripartite tricarboxylate transporter substrate binding protein [Pseudomonadota bacterium]MBU2470492.1 tripartite tricarboxylate transporter substrate binding protein [Pseudomonadota bacterium]MBU2516400.1 tripartite tricarboxylate transporter substrate binding protein [Pseudomonadota bacterium]
MGRKLLTVLLAMVMALAIAGPSLAGDYPSKPIKLIINFSAGGTTDTAARLMSSKATEVLQQALICMNKPGAGGTLGVSEVARAKGNGYTIGTCNMPAVAIIPQIRQVPYKPFKDLVQVCAVMPYEYALMVRGDSPWKTWEEFVDHVKKNPGKVTYASVGTGTTNHLVTARIGKELGLDWKHVPFQGGVKETAALLGGHVDIINNTTASVASSVKAGKIRVLLVTSEDRLKMVPDVPTMKDKGFKFSQISYMSIVAPAGTPQAALDKLSAAFKAACEDKGVIKACGKLDLHPKFMPGKQYQAMLEQLSTEWGALLPDLGVKVNK